MIYLLRHGEIDQQGEKRFVGCTDLPLTDEGVRQAEQWREKLSSTRFENVFSSDLSRTRETARIIAGDRNDQVQALPKLREIDLGEWKDREDEGILLVPRAGEMLHRLKSEKP